MKIYKVSRTNPKSGVVYDSWVVDLGKTPNGKRERHAFKTFTEAQAWLRKYKKANAKYGQLAGILSASQYALAVEAFKRLLGAKLTDAALTDAVELFIKREGMIAERLTISEATARYMQRFADDQELYSRNSKYYTTQFATFFGEGKLLCEVTEAEAIEFFEAVERAQYSSKTFNNMHAVLRAFFNWCIEHKLAAENPILVVKQKRIAYKDPTFIKVDVLRDALSLIEADTELPAADKQWILGFMALSFFCGIRTSEILRLTEDAIHPDDERPFVRISTTKGAAKGIKGRMVDLEPNAAAWLRKYPFVGGRSIGSLGNLRRRLAHGALSGLADAFTKNVGRHSYITYHTAKYRDYARTEAYVGTSATMRARHYQGLATTADGEAYFAIFPS